MAKKKQPNHQGMLQGAIDEHAAYGGHDGHGGLQKPKDHFKPARNPFPTGTMFRESTNQVPQVGPASAAGNMTGPGGSGGSSGSR